MKFDPWRTYRAFRRSGSSPLLPIAAAAAMAERKRISALPASGSFALALSRETLDVINGSLVLRLYDRACCIFVSDGLSALIEPQALQRRVGRTGKLRIFPPEPFWFAPQRKYCGRPAREHAPKQQVLRESAAQRDAVEKGGVDTLTGEGRRDEPRP